MSGSLQAQSTSNRAQKSTMFAVTSTSPGLAWKNIRKDTGKHFILYVQLGEKKWLVLSQDVI